MYSYGGILVHFIEFSFCHFGSYSSPLRSILGIIKSNISETSMRMRMRMRTSMSMRTIMRVMFDWQKHKQQIAAKKSKKRRKKHLKEFCWPIYLSLIFSANLFGGEGEQVPEMSEMMAKKKGALLSAKLIQHVT